MIEEAKKLDIPKLLVTCYDDNIGSRKVIEYNGGVFERYIEHTGKTVRRYWIDTFRSEKELIKNLEIELLGYEVRHDIKRLDELLADDFFECGKMGAMFGKEECLEWLPQEKTKQLHAMSVSVHVLSHNIMQVRYIAEIS